MFNGMHNQIKFNEQSIRAEGHPCVSLTGVIASSITSEINRGMIMARDNDNNWVIYEDGVTGDAVGILEYPINPEQSKIAQVILHGTVAKKNIQENGQEEPQSKTIQNLINAGIYPI